MSSNSSYSASLAQIVSNITLYVDFITLIFGTIGGICNLITFTSQQMRQSSSVFYLLCSIVFKLLTILFCVVTRLAVDRSRNNLQNQSTAFCKLRYYLVVTLPALASYYMCLTTFDRCLSTSNTVGVRAWCQNKVVKRLAAGTLIVGLLISMNTLIYFDIYNNSCQISPPSIYTFVFAGYLVIVVSVLPHLLMLIFSIITVLAIRKSRRRVVQAMAVMHILNRRGPRRFELKIIKV